MSNKISVIVPVYNTIKYINKCIMSIQKQTYRNIEIILVDDGSTDGSGELCDKYSEMDERISVIHKPNGGSASARKSGVENATGQFICWVDSDDYVDENFIEAFVKLQDETDADIVAMALFHEINEETVIIKNGFEAGVYKTQDLLPKLLYTGEFFQYGINPHLVTKMTRTEVLKEVYEGIDLYIIAGEDVAAVYPTILACDKIAVSDDAYYHYVQRAGSVTKKKIDDENARIERLILRLSQTFKRTNVFDVLEKQLVVFRNYLYALRNIAYFDDNTDKVLAPFGGVEKCKSIAIYGAGVLGQKIYDYLSGIFEDVGWFDQKYFYYQSIGMPVNNPLEIVKKEYDAIIVANISFLTYKDIESYLKKMGVSNDTIIWFTDEFVKGEI